MTNIIIITSFIIIGCILDKKAQQSNDKEVMDGYKTCNFDNQKV